MAQDDQNYSEIVKRVKDIGYDRQHLYILKNHLIRKAVAKKHALKKNILRATYLSGANIQLRQEMYRRIFNPWILLLKLKDNSSLET